MDVVEDKDHYSIQLEMPGMDEKDIKVSLADNVLTITGEKSTSKKNEDKNFFLEKLVMENTSAPSHCLQLWMLIRPKQLSKRECFGLSCLRKKKRREVLVTLR